MTKAESTLGADQAPVTGALHVVDPGLVNEGAKNVPYFTPIQDPAAGTARDPQPEGSLFSPLKLRGLTLQNRIIVSPMCQYSADDGHMTAWHKTHLQGFAVRGAGLVLTEVQAVVPEGRISPEDLGIWDDSHLGPAKEVIDFIHSQGGHIGIQIGHAGRKASTVAPWIDRKAVAGEKGRGWSDKVYGPSAVAYSKDTYVPKEMTLDDIETFKAKWVDAVKRAVKVGYDTIEIHAAHGYLINNFLSPTSNTRTDRYGGSFENRTRLLVELTELTRAHVPDNYPVLVRLAGTDYLEFDPSIPQWDIDQAQRLARILADKGVDFLDISGGGQDARMRVAPGPKYQAHLAAAIRKAVQGTGALVGSVGGIASGRDAAEVLADGQADAVLVGRGFLKDPNLVWTWADELGIDVHAPSQYGWPFGRTRTHRPSKH
ncbi:Putative NADH:flavin oxidoreductase/NADH oxidase, aldolase-type TIM barrel, NADPH dehydrogenase YqjM [Colletotrichum destructivum]|uniref:NADH:flavin oxidoreductase/NADH oxidase, aldolase-type TIM barrel, NADPH dehydrogenase YqjM n=1 Tax=Colletotrichum destructivum TaxID=34406 RepID=A0AAX4IRS2_9PEZI|nr:Putative NADH:flavin oxidoreductase/NADH oxidase, aldolase-type TIM barrel, NADPH dehydrogenase YqjM [Colletotrichum destructivum]